MAYIETIKRGKRKSYYLTHTIRFNDKFKKARLLLGKGDIPLHKLKKLSEVAGKKLKGKIKEIKNVRNLVVLNKKNVKKLNQIKKGYKKLISSISDVEYKVIEKQHLIRFTFNTNAIEGSTISLKETSHILDEGISPEGKDLREIYEIENTRKAYNFMKKHEKVVNLDFIRKIHYNLTYNTLEDNAGRFRKIQVYMHGSKHVPTKATEVNKEMISMMRWINNHGDLHPVILAVYVHHFFIAIHPFIDGNGRTARLLLNFMLMKAGFPPICIKKEERIKYADYLEDARNGDITGFLYFIIKKIEEAYNEIVDTIK